MTLDPERRRQSADESDDAPEVSDHLPPEDEAFEAAAVASWLRAREALAVKEARDRARADKNKATEAAAIASWLQARQTS